jgi:hypothetical protein
MATIAVFIGIIFITLVIIGIVDILKQIKDIL